MLMENREQHDEQSELSLDRSRQFIADARVGFMSLATTFAGIDTKTLNFEKQRALNA
jgi:hypothetical protein